MTRTFNHIFLCIVTMVIFSFILTGYSAEARQDKDSNAGYIFYKGNTLYEQGSYDEAISEYSKLLAQGVESGSLYYNLGNCYIKKGAIGKAILNYERAKRLIPRDSDLKSNYSFALSQLEIQSVNTSPPWHLKATRTFDVLSINELTVLLSAIFVVIILLMITRLFFPLSKKSFYALRRCPGCVL